MITPNSKEICIWVHSEPCVLYAYGLESNGRKGRQRRNQQRNGTCREGSRKHRQAEVAMSKKGHLDKLYQEERRKERRSGNPSASPIAKEQEKQPISPVIYGS